MSLNPIPVTEVPLKRKVTKSRQIYRGDSDSSTYTTASENSRDMATQTTEAMPSPRLSTTHNLARMSGGAGSDKSVSFVPTPPASPGEKYRAEAELVRDKKDKSDKAKRPSFKRNLSSLWKVLDPPELAHNTGALHNLVKAQDENHKRNYSADSTTLVETTAHTRQHKQR
ncbi:hypothetical protein CBER1_00478 [Cercospora berteroae]|uniref:Uncharacterized protein n=1 Tax=Cercospora berteroae TaxID=357750 RepID=A0A2S6CBC1_9PEZI|nr:hypothetical protein CBER1_00478 [Cercospora berteroae]